MYSDASHNRVNIIGTIEEGPDINHKNHNEDFYELIVSSRRHSGVVDLIRVIVSKKKISMLGLKKGDRVSLLGEIRTYNSDSGSVVVYVHVHEMIKTETTYDDNQVVIEGSICKNQGYKVLQNSRELCKFIIAVNREFHKTSYIPCMSWGMAARAVKDYPLGTYIMCYGRIQSREYVRKCDENKKEMTYELSLSSVVPS